MVKNKGGNKAKKQGRKFVNQPKTSCFTRMAKEEDELYAVVQKCYGHGMVDVLCIDNITRLCIIRSKFKGRGKQDNMVKLGSWLLVGRRSWEVVVDKKEKCDLLEVYSSEDINKIKNNTLNKKYNFSVFDSEEDKKNMTIKEETLMFIEEDLGIPFEDENTFNTNINQINSNSNSNNESLENDLDIDLDIDGISFDDI